MNVQVSAGGKMKSECEEEMNEDAPDSIRLSRFGAAKGLVVTGVIYLVAGIGAVALYLIFR